MEALLDYLLGLIFLVIAILFFPIITWLSVILFIAAIGNFVLALANYPIKMY